MIERVVALDDEIMSSGVQPHKADFDPLEQIFRHSCMNCVVRLAIWVSDEELEVRRY
jgi:hypothetical protein